ncbi:hypothetical protein FRB96_000755 [Tulasnella sp. 330]|nr:hypothetical protein FRB96_000755 [Tulasnella sp. 330]KAG8879650.1 hypothetical protein FRB97_001561 [Tulasnella sp. 331]KAG8885940.1 hypothetical protein FRB98_001546 [Tulasnella sp. 332]
MHRLKVVNDTILASGTDVEGYSPREVNVRNAMFILTCIMPLVAASFAFFGVPNWCKRNSLFSFHKIVSLWFFSVGFVGVALYHLPGQAPRILFIWAILHGQIEVVLNMLLLGFNGYQALAATWTFGLVQYGLTLSVEYPLTVFTVTAVVGGANDLLIFEALLYGKQYGLAAGAFCHVISAVTVFLGIGVNIGVVPWNVITFFSLWGHIFFMLQYILTSPTRVKDPRSQDDELEHEDPPNNPLHHVNFTPSLIGAFIAFGLVSSTIVAFLIAWVLPSD